MTTERSGMSLEQVSRAIRAEACNSNAQTFTWLQTLADHIDAHISRDTVVSDEDVRHACETFDHVGWKVMEGDARADFKESVRRMLESFAARHTAVPDELHFYMTYTASETEAYKVGDKDLMINVHREYAKGWNACREAMLAQRDGGK